MGLGSWDPNWIQASLAFLAFWAAVVAAIVSWKAYQTSYRPMLRAVPLFFHDDSGGATFEPEHFVLKNIGRGPAISVAVLRGRGTAPTDLLGQIDAVEPLGDT
jgi:hypothetical protein